MSLRPAPVMGAAEWALLLFLSLLWGGSFFFAKLALAALPPLTIVLARFALAAVALNLALRLAGHALPLRCWRAFLVMGALNNLVPFGLLTWGQTEVTSGLAAILNATTPLFTVLLAHFLVANEKLTLSRLGGVIVGLLGVAVMIGPGALAGLGGEIVAQLACLAAALSYACAGIYGRRLSEMPPLAAAAGQAAASSLLALPLALLVDRPWMLPLPDAGTWAALLGLALLSTALAYVVYFRILAASGATNLLLVTFLIPVSALFLGTTLLGEALAARQLAGMALIGFGLAAIDGRPLALLRRRREPRHREAAHCLPRPARLNLQASERGAARSPGQERTHDPAPIVRS